MVLRHLKDSSKDETGVQWKWWDQHNRKALWYRALSQQDVSIQKPVLNDHWFNHTMQSNPTRMDDEDLFVLWIHCIDWEGNECMRYNMDLRHLYGTWREWARGSWVTFDVSEQCLPS